MKVGVSQYWPQRLGRSQRPSKDTVLSVMRFSLPHMEWVYDTSRHFRVV